MGNGYWALLRVLSCCLTKLRRKARPSSFSGLEASPIDPIGFYKLLSSEYGTHKTAIAFAPRPLVLPDQAPQKGPPPPLCLS